MSPKELIPPGLAYIAGNITSRQNILGAEKEAKARWAKGLGLPEEGETIFFAGCGYQYMRGLESLMSLVRKMDKTAIGAERMVGLAGLSRKLGINTAGLYSKVMGKGGEDARPLVAAVRVLQRLGVEFGYLGEDEPCCGGLLYYAGMHQEFARNSRNTYERLKSRGVKRIISIVPSCTYTLRELMPKYVEEYDIEVRHFLEVVLERLSSVRLRFPRSVKVTYHDPCQLGRYLGLVDEPRRILRAIAGIELVETEWTSGEWATCCGGGGGFEAVFPEFSRVLAVNRVDELLETGADIIVTNCPGCVMQLESGLKEKPASEVKVLDLAEVLAMAMEV